MDRRGFLRTGLGVAALAAGAGPARARRGLVRFSKAPLAIHSGAAVHRFTVELALSARQQSQGLMFRRRMARDAGMLFVYDTPRIVSMWMRNTYVPLDMIFIAADATIARIVERTVPLSSRTISSGREVIGVLELNGGTAARLGLSRGDRIAAAILGGAAGARRRP